MSEYPNSDYERWAVEFWLTFNALEIDRDRKGLMDDLDLRTIAHVAALVVLTDRVDAVYQATRG